MSTQASAGRVFDFSAVRRAPLRHWLVVLILTLVGAILGERPWLMHVRHGVYYLLQKTLQTSNYPDVVAVVIEDAEFYHPPLNGVKPLNRDYLATLMEHVQRGNPEVIALDVELRSLAPDASIADPNPVQTTNFLQRVRKIADSVPVVLARALSVDQAHETYLHQANIFDHFDFGQRARILSGYILLPNDIREVPPMIRDDRGQPIDSFAGAIVRAKTRHRYRDSKRTLYALFRPETDFDPHPARLVLAASDASLKEWFAHRVVLIGGTWHVDAFESGDPVDAHLTPIGNTAGLFVHANYIQTLLSAPLKGVNPWLRLFVESAFAVGIAAVFLAARGRWTFYLITAVLVSFVLVTYFFWQVLGVFFEAVVPVTLLSGHAAIEQIAEWKRLAQSASHGG